VLPRGAAETAHCLTEVRVRTQLAQADAYDPGANRVIAVSEKGTEPNGIGDTGERVL